MPEIGALSTVVSWYVKNVLPYQGPDILRHLIGIAQRSGRRRSAIPSGVAAAHAADALNAVLPESRQAWDERRLFTVVCAFLAVTPASDGSVTVTWTREPSEIAALLLRGARADAEELAHVAAALETECAAVAALVADLPGLRSDLTLPPVPSRRAFHHQPPQRLSERVLTLALVPMATLVVAAEMAREARDARRRLAALAEFASALRLAGFSTAESLAILREHGATGAEIERALQRAARDAT